MFGIYNNTVLSLFEIFIPLTIILVLNKKLINDYVRRKLNLWKYSES